MPQKFEKREQFSRDGDTTGAPRVLPNLSLPKGGGALRGIGEKLSTNPATGAATLDLPIYVSPARNGMQPDLRLRYDSGAGNGPWGLGWRLPMASITRKTDKGLPRYRDAEETDTFILSSADDLAPALISQQSGTWPRDAYTAGGFTVERYRPRVERDFLRIERWREGASGEVHWRVVSRDNITSLFGRSDNTRIFDPHDRRHIFTWLLEESFDDRGNRIVYQYKREDGVGVSPRTIYEHLRAGKPSYANRYLKRISYGNRTAGASDWLFELAFDYGEYDDAQPWRGELNPWLVRADPFSSYRSSFEVRTYRLCHRVLQYHHFDGQTGLGPDPALVRSTDLRYDENAVASFLKSATQTGYVQQNGVYQSLESYPAVLLGYTESHVDPTTRTFDSASAANLPEGLDGQAYQFVDLDGEGLAGILSQQGAGWFYKRNLGQGAFAAVELVAPRPVIADLGAGARLMDLAGDGTQYLVRLDAQPTGFHERAGDAWSEFAPFRHAMRESLSNPNLRFIDLDGDGIPDLLVTEDEAFRWYPSLGRDGFGPPQFETRPRDEDSGPALVFSEPYQTIFLADMSGDGLTDLVRIRDGQICYWPNLGYGRFGAKVTMDGAPTFDDVDDFDARRIRLADVDGSGTTDVLYVGRGRARFWANCAGNSFAPAVEIGGLPEIDTLSSVLVVDLLGNGTACLAWSSPLPGDARLPISYVDLMGGVKPHLLQSLDNQLGLQVRIHHAPSTLFYVADRLAGRPWATRLPFPVQVVDRVETLERFTNTKTVTSYRYHHGFFDGVEREFRGFGMVEQEDSDEFAAFAGIGLFPGGATNVDRELHAPTVLTKTWFHTGAWFQGPTLSRHFADEYYAGDARAVALPDSVALDSMAPEDAREAARALVGRTLRVELYAKDGNEAPYSVAESNYQIKLIQPGRAGHHGSFAAFGREALRYSYERNPQDPRVDHEVTVAVDELGYVTEAVKIAYPRRSVFDVGDVEQQRAYISYTLDTYTHRVDDRSFYRIGSSIEHQSYEITIPNPTAVLSFRDASALWSSASDIDYLTKPDYQSRQRRLIDWRLTYYWKNDLSGDLPFGNVESLGLPHRSYRLALSDAMATAIFSGLVNAGVLAEGAYVNNQANRTDLWWAPAELVTYDGKHFYLPIASTDAFNNTTAIGYDEYELLPTSVTDAAMNVVAVAYDYRTLQIAQLTDANLNLSKAVYDAFGRVVAVALVGKNGELSGDDLPARPTTTVDYTFAAGNQPSRVHQATREQHAAIDPNPRRQETFTYFDGAGRMMLGKANADRGKAYRQDPITGLLVRDANGNKILDADVPRFVGTGRVVFDNKARPVKQYEPFFSSVSAWDPESEVAEFGVTPVLHYDPLGRIVRIDKPDGTFTTSKFDSWSRVDADENDNVAESIWYAKRQQRPPGDPDRRASDLAFEHRDTPMRMRLDPLNRVYLTSLDNRVETLDTRLALDIQNRTIAATDPLGYQTLRDYDLVGRALRTASPDAGLRRVLADVDGRAIREFDARDVRVRTTYDVLRRPIEHYATQAGGASEQLVERLQYGEGVANDQVGNLRGRVYRQFDGTGLVTFSSFDFKGNLALSTRELATQAPMATWPGLVGLATTAQLDSYLHANRPQLLHDSFVTSSVWDALNRQSKVTTPDGTTQARGYGDGGLLDTVDVKRPSGVANRYLAGVIYNERRQRAIVRYGNGVASARTYDPLTFRLTELLTTRPVGASPVQDLLYTFDAVGNILEVSDAAQQTIYFANNIILADSHYRYDPVYRLTYADGREHLGQMSTPPSDVDQDTIPALPDPNDPQRLAVYDENYVYDKNGNLKQRVHHVNNVGWTSVHNYQEGSNNRLISMVDANGATLFALTYDPNGNPVTTSNLASLGWDYANRLTSADRGGGGTLQFAYDLGGVRARKIVLRQGTPTEERIYVGDYEVYRQYDGQGSVTLERRTIHISDGHDCAAIIDAKVFDGAAIANPTDVVRYQLTNHLGSSMIELDDSPNANVISFEEYHPFGTTSYRSTKSQEVGRKRYRYLGKERDAETGFYYVGARYYAPWLGRWISPDPGGMIDGLNQYAFARNNPIRLTDTSGKAADEAPASQPEAVQSTVTDPAPDPHSELPSDLVPSGRGTSEPTIPVDLQEVTFQAVTDYFEARGTRELNLVIASVFSLPPLPPWYPEPPPVPVSPDPPDKLVLDTKQEPPEIHLEAAGGADAIGGKHSQQIAADITSNVYTWKFVAEKSEHLKLAFLGGVQFGAKATFEFGTAGFKPSGSSTFMVDALKLSIDNVLDFSLSFGAEAEFDAKAFTPHLIPGQLDLELTYGGFEKPFKSFGKSYTFEVHPFLQIAPDLGWNVPWGGGQRSFGVNFSATMGLRGTLK